MMKHKTYVVGLTGASGAGKTTFINQIKATFGESDICLISQDNYYKPRELQEKDDQGVENFDLPSSINGEEFANDIQKLIKGQTLQREEYTFNNELVTPKILTFSPAPILLIEGIFIYHFPEIMRLIDLKLFLDVKETVALSRRIRRDQIERNYPLEDVLYRYEHHVLPTYEKYIQPYRSKADVVINNNINFDIGLNMLTEFLKSKL